jgi:hypothetical protein
MSGAPNPATDLCGALLDAMCTEYVECQRPQQFRDFDHCRSELDCYGVTALREAQAEGHILLHESALVACFRDFYASPCYPPRAQTSVFNDPLDVYQFVSQCPGVLTPLQGVGDVCKADAECEFRLKCQTASCPGVCAPRFELGEPCSPDGEQCSIPYGICQGGTCRIPAEVGGSCADDLDCNRDLLCDPSTHRCIAPARPGLGGGCIRDINGGKPALLCQPDLFCNDDDAIGKPGVCAEFEREGQACQYNGCAAGLECVALGGGPRVCHAKAPKGGLCDYGAASCQGDLSCVATGGAPPTGVCSEPPSLGQPCQFDCGPTLHCNGGVCVAAAYAGDRCEPGDFCQNSRCVDGTCRAYVHLGQPCKSADDCLEHACQNGVCVDKTGCLSPF